MPFWYTTFHVSASEGLPVMRPLWFEYPKEQALYDMDDQWLVGRDLLVKPVTQPGRPARPPLGTPLTRSPTDAPAWFAPLSAMGRPSPYAVLCCATRRD
jgi:hypothetical protein